MMRLLVGVTFVLGFVASQTSLAQKAIEFVSVREASDYSDAGLDLGNAGFWFANFNATGPVTSQPVDANDRNSLPSWVTPVVLNDTGSDDYPFGDFVYSEGGQQDWAVLTLPDGETGLSGSWVDPESANNSNNTISMLNLGPGTPPDFFLHIVADNTNNAHDSTNRIRARAESGDGMFDVDDRADLAGFNGSPDVYTFRYVGWEDGDFIKLQLNSGVDGVQAGVAGLMFDVVPEPTGAILSFVALVGLSGFAAGRRRRRQR